MAPAGACFLLTAATSVYFLSVTAEDIWNEGAVETEKSRRFFSLCAPSIFKGPYIRQNNRVSKKVAQSVGVHQFTGVIIPNMPK